MSLILEENIITLNAEKMALHTEVDLLRAYIDKLKAALKPFSRCKPGFHSKIIAPKDLWLWKPSGGKGPNHGINLQHVLDARAVLRKKV